MTSARADLRVLGEALATIVLTWLALGFWFDRPITQGDGSAFVVPYTQSALHGGFDWTHHLYRFGVLGGSAMHDFAGTLPMIQLCAALGLSATLTVNLVTLALQLWLAFFAIVTARALAGRAPTAGERVVATWLAGFAPLLGWRFGIGHENLLFGALPLVAAVALVLAARAEQLSRTAIVIGALAVWHGVSTLGAQTLVCGAVFGAPLAIAAVWPGRGTRGTRFGRARWAALAALAAGVLVALPRLAGMLHFATGDDPARSLDEAVTYSYGAARWSDWLGSLAWTIAGKPRGGLHEHDYPIGPIVVIAIALWPRGAPKRLGIALAAGAALAILFATDVAPFSTVILRVVAPLRAFRVPARALIPLVAFVPTLALAAWWSRSEPPARRAAWLWIAGGAAVIAVLRERAPIVREVCAWLGCLALVAIVRWRPAWTPRVVGGLALVGALGVAAFDDRLPHDRVAGPVEQVPRALHDSAIAADPALASPLARVVVIADTPWDVGLAFAAELSSIDGDYNPTRRYLQLINALAHHEFPSTTVVFRLEDAPFFSILQQLYNVRDVIKLDASGASITAQPEAVGAAWFPSRIAIAEAADVAHVLRHSGDALHATIAGTAWLAPGDAARIAELPATCDGAHVREVTPDALGQSARISVDAAAPCVLVVATNYVSALHARALVDGAQRDAPIFPIDVALVGVLVPRGATQIAIAPEPWLPWWSRAGELVGIALLGAALALARGQRGASASAVADAAAASSG